MSLILDALKKADAERALGRAPGLQAQPMAWTDDDETAARRPRWLWPALGAAVLLALGAAGAWWLKTVGTPKPVELAQTAPAAPPSPRSPEAAPAPPAVLLPAPAPPTVAPATQPLDTVPPHPIRPIVPTPPPALQRATTPPKDPAPLATPPRKPLPATAAAPAAEPPKPPPAAATVPPVESLPEAFRRTLPPLAVGGSIHAERPADRILIVNGQPLKEGDTVDGRVTLESIGRQGATWRAGDQRFSTKF